MHRNVTHPWMRAMLSGDFEEAWKFSDTILEAGLYRSPELPRHHQCIWDGTSLGNKRVLVRCYHGLGDTIQFIRFIPQLKQIAKEVLVWAQPPIIEILKSVEGIDYLFPLHDGTPEVDYDVDVELMELPHIFRTTVDTIPAKIPYIDVEPLYLTKTWENLSVGVVWQAGDWDGNRTMGFENIRPLGELDGIDLIVLQSNAAAAGWQEGFGIHPGEFSLHDFARIVRGLDLIITVDSMPAHMAGSQGVAVWTLLHAEADWRWMEEREDSPWYPTMKLFRQEHPGDWKGVINKVVKELRGVVHAKDVFREKSRSI